MNALHIAAEHGQTEIVKFLIRHGMNEDMKAGYDRKTPLILAAENGHQYTVDALLDENAEINARDDDGKTALIHAAENGHDGTANVLIRKGADLNIKDDHGRTALGYAIKKSHKQVIKILQDAGAAE